MNIERRDLVPYSPVYSWTLKMGEVSSETSVDSTGLHNITSQKIFTIVRTSNPEYRFNMEIERNSTQKNINICF